MQTPQQSREARALEEHLRGALKHTAVVPLVYDTLGSTNDRAKELALAGAKENTVVVALEQTAGRGRQGRSFFSPAGTGVYMSLLLRPKTLDAPENITIAAAVATARAVERISGRAAEIKWVNDVYLAGKKVSGILTESGFLPDGSAWAVLGIGVNLLPPEGGFPEELAGSAGAVRTEGEALSLRSKLIAAILDGFLDLYTQGDRSALLRAYREKNFLRGKTVDVVIGSKTRTAEVLDVAEDFGLAVRYADGSRETLRSGEVHLRPTEGENQW